jgi:hypothetical protein
VVAETVAIDDLHALGRLAQFLDHGLEPHDRFDLLVEGVGDPVHAADRLQHGGLHVDDLFEDQAGAPELGLHHVGHLQRRAARRRMGVAAGRGAEARAGGARIGVALRQVAIGRQVAQQLLLIETGQLLVQRALVDGLGQQLGEGAARVVDGLALGDHLAGEVQLGRTVGVDHHLQRHAQLLAIAEDGVVPLRDAGGPALK